MMRKMISILFMSLCIVGCFSVKSAHQPCGKSVDLQLAMRKLWEDHITYTRNYIISAIGDLDDTSAVADRLMHNQDEIGQAIEPYYGAAASQELAHLLRDHISIAAEVVTSAIQSDHDALQANDQKWHKNADEIAQFLSQANLNWTKKDLTDLLYKHLELTTGEVVSRLEKNWSEDISFYDRGHTHMLMFADVLTEGLVKQFPEKF